LRHAALDLPLHIARVDGASNILSGDETQDRHLAGLRIDFNVAELSGEARRHHGGVHRRRGDNRPAGLRALRRDVEPVPVRGNLDTRLRKLDAEEYDALVLAAAGIHRLGFRERVAQYFTVDEMCPAVGQGALALEIRKGDETIERAVRSLDDPLTHQAVRAERAALRELGGGCQVPIAAHAWCEDTRLRLLGVVADPDGSRIVRAAAAGSLEEPEALGAEVARSLIEQGAKEILGEVASG